MLQQRIAANETAFAAFLNLFLKQSDDSSLAQNVASFKAVVQRASDFIDIIRWLNYTNVAMVGTGDGKRRANITLLSPAILKKTPPFYAAQDTYVKGLVVITDSLFNLLNCSGCRDANKRQRLVDDELLKQIILLSSPINRFISIRHDIGTPVPKICSADSGAHLASLAMHYHEGLMSYLSHYAEKMHLAPPLKQEVNDFIQRHAELKNALLMTSADWLMLMIRDYSDGQVAGRAWHVLDHPCIGDPR
ncbi:MAG: hypothetical protein ACMX3H_04470 [Sodalis sp. (in: enterobacteria)]|uniref:hypothetical protein n=1 Tax=Sodalis sp. (in: enterobacteria) TaxID=1898979 RepID=UPI0039E3D7C6